MISSSSIVSSCIDPSQMRSASVSSTSANIDQQQNFSTNKLAPNLIDLIPPPPAYPPPTSADVMSGMQVVSFSVQPSMHDLTSTGRPQ